MNANAIYAAALVSLAAALAPAGHAASLVVSDKLTPLAGAAAATTALLIDAGLPLRDTGKGTFAVEAKNLHCDLYPRGGLGNIDPLAGLPTVKCRLDAQNLKDTKTGKPFAEGRAVATLMERIQRSDAGGSLRLTDCAMGYCGAFAKSIRCVVNTAADNFTAGERWVCTFTDDQP